MSSDEGSQNSRVSEYMTNMEERLTDLIEIIQEIRQDRYTNLKTLTQQKSEIQEEISRIRIRINEHLDELERELLSELTKTVDDNSKHVEHVFTKINEKEIKLCEIYNDIEKSKTNTTNFPVVLSNEQIGAIVQEEEQYLKTLFYHKSLEDISITCQFNRPLRMLSDDIARFGIISTVTKPVMTSPFRREERSLLALVTDNLKLTLAYEINLNKVSTQLLIRGCLSLPFGDLMFSDGKNTRLTVYNNNGSFKFEITTGMVGAFDLTSIDDTTVAVTYAYSAVINIIDIIRKKVVKTIKTNGWCFGITYRSGTLIYCVQGKGLQMLNLKDYTVSDLYRENLPSCAYVITIGNNICFTNSDQNSVTLVDSALNIIWKFEDRTMLRFPQGITADGDGNVFITGCFSNNVVFISADGRKIKQVLGLDDGLWSPRGIHYNRSRDILLVANEVGSVFLYNFNLHV